MKKFDYSKTEYEIICEECMLDEDEKIILKMRCMGKSAQEILTALDEKGKPMSSATLSRRIIKIDDRIKKMIREK